MADSTVWLTELFNRQHCLVDICLALGGAAQEQEAHPCKWAGARVKGHKWFGQEAVFQLGGGGVRAKDHGGGQGPGAVAARSRAAGEKMPVGGQCGRCLESMDQEPMFYEARGLDLEGSLVELVLVFPLLPPLAGVRMCRAPGILGKMLAASQGLFLTLV